MSKKPENINSVDIENAIAAAGENFTAEAVVRMLDADVPAELRSRVERFIASDDTLFHDEKWNCCTRKSFFTGKKFIITPDDWEISAGILFPGHRFIPYLPESVFPSTVKLQENGKPVAVKKMITPLGTSFHYHILLGSEQIFDFFLADDPANEILKNKVSRTDSVTLTV